MNKHVSLFNKIALAYHAFFNYQTKMFLPIIGKNTKLIGALPSDSFLDIGCGTGALVTVLTKAGFTAIGVDAAPNMVSTAKKSGANCSLGDIQYPLPHADRSFDFVIASFVAHGLGAELRGKLYAEAGRLARKAVIIHDYHGKQPAFTRFVERLEGGDFFNFIEHGEAEFKSAFDKAEIINISKTGAWYVGWIN